MSSFPEPEEPALLSACPFRGPFLEESGDTFAGVLGGNELFQIDSLSPGQSLVKVNRVPGVNRFLGERQRSRTHGLQLTYGFVYNGRKFVGMRGTIREADGDRFVPGYLSPSQDQFCRALLSDQRWKRYGRNRRIATQLDLWKTPGSIARSVNHVADRRQFGSSTQARTL